MILFCGIVFIGEEAMKSSIIFLFIIIIFVMYFQTSSRAQDISIQSSGMGNVSLLRITDIKADLMYPITIRTGMNDADFSAIVWRGLTMNYMQSKQLLIEQPRVIHIDRGVLNSFSQKRAYDENLMVRQAWSETFGFDIWYPYYRAKAVEGWVKKKVSVKVFKLKGEAEFEKGRIMYTFKTKF
jgi:hypothetical protein